jgi:hypothetical protein
VPVAALKPAVAVKALVAYPRHVATSALTSVFIGLLAEHFNLKPVRDANIGAPAQSLAAVDFVLTSIGGARRNFYSVPLVVVAPNKHLSPHEPG